MPSDIKLRIELSPIFDKKLRQLHPEIIAAFDETLELLWDNPNNEHLRRHFLKEKYAGYQGIDVTENYRAVFKESKTKNVIVIKFHTIGTHNDLYG